MNELHEAAAGDDAEKVQELLDSGANPNLRDEESRTPLHAAVEGRSQASVEALIRDMRTDLEAVNAQGHSPIDLAEAQALSLPDDSHEMRTLEQLADRIAHERDVSEMADVLERKEAQKVAEGLRNAARHDRRMAKMDAQAEREVANLRQAQPAKETP